MNEQEDDQLRETIAQYRNQLEYLQSLLDPVRKLVETVLLVEQVLKTHFLPTDVEQPTLGPLLHSRKAFFGGKFFPNVAYALDLRNRTAHFDPRGMPTDSEYEKASKVFHKVIELHCLELEKDLPAEPDVPISKPDDQDLPPSGTPSNTPGSPIYVPEFEPVPVPMLDAGKTDPDISASTLAEYTFCPRAGVLTHEGSYSDPEEELPSLALLPWYEKEAIEEAYTHALYMLFAFPVGLVAGVVILSLMFIGHFRYPFLLIGMLAGWAVFATRAYKRWREIGERRLAAQFATECNPVPGKNAFQPVDWWGLLLAGYEVRRPESALRDERWKLSGKPRRILQKGSMSIPVHRIRKPEGPILPQHIVRVMAHCHLIEATEGASSPFAVVLFGNTYQGLTVPNTNENRERFYTALERVRRMIVESDAGERQPPEPVTGNVCSACHFGHPRPIALEDKTKRYDEPLDPVLFHNGKKVFHCDCGDRFNWKPKHDRNRKLRRIE